MPTKKRNPPDATREDLRPIKKRLDALSALVADLETRVTALEKKPRRTWQAT